MNVSGVGGSSTILPSQFSELSSEDFMRIIFTELTNQDPLAPSDSGALLQQLNSIRSIESDMKMTKMLESLVHENQLAASGNLIGKFVGGLTEQNFRVAGWVVSVIRQGNAVYLELDNGWVLPMKGVETIIDPSLLPQDPTNPNPNPDPTTPDPTDPDPTDPGGTDEDGYDDGADGHYDD